MQCQPCSEQDRKTAADYWCIECEEALCESCKSQHLSFKLSKNHNVSTFSPIEESVVSHIEKEEAVCVVKDGCDMCEEHPGKFLEYICINHEKACCVLCKRQYHRNCSKVEKVDDIVDDTTLTTTYKDLLSAIGERKTYLTEMAVKEKSNLMKIETIKDKCIEELTNTRITINEYLDSLQNEVEKENTKKTRIRC
ncbi:unnamed protein product [Mytilus coruscus]|uniref:B box-type domain-containing protein n=1 Tax=Mytilus coruscus TaxID=42192 RepID=A0A6J8E658_MYTCO|nr:unnamed protein product [Mytilus coruscus]